MVHIPSLKAETLIHISGMGITNTTLTSVIIVSFITVLLVTASFTFKVNKLSIIQYVVETLYSGLGSIYKSIMGSDYKGSVLYSFVLTFFIYILFSNWSGLLPFVGTVAIFKPTHTSEISNVESISFMDCLKERNCYLTQDFKIAKPEHLTQLFRAPTTDLSITISLALLSIVVTNLLGFKHLGFKYIKKYINLKTPIDFIVGILELISEIGKTLSFSFRLFGNIFAGEVLLAVIAYITYSIGSFPFFGLEVFVGAIQAFVFFLLTTVFISMAVSDHS